ncbi:MAG: 5'/3'-nucleotidase SurE [Synechococcales cyanobacterium K44_A2020_017]|nr:5'/3'-nucleotidase SurE [Synechococcales cyanobacterium K44_A2020_017]
MTFILTNDDGIDAPGLQALRNAVGDNSVIVAPQEQYSGCSHQITRGAAIAIQRRSDTVYAINGTPADCTRVAATHLCPQGTWVLSGINAGGNLGADLYVSGTVAAVREAALLRLPGIAFSHYIHRRRPINWERATQLTVQVLDRLLGLPQKPGCFWNVNLPHLGDDDPPPNLVFCSCCTQPLPTEFEVIDQQFRYTGEYGDRTHDPNSDVAVCFGGNVAISQVCLW